MNGQESTNLSFSLPQFSFEVFSFIELAIAIAIPILVYYLLLWLGKTLRNLGAINRDSGMNKVYNAITIIVPILIFMTGFADVARDSVFISLLFFVVVSVVGAAAAIDPIKAMLGALLINSRGDLKIGDQIQIGELKGRIVNFGPFNMTIETATGSRVFVPNQQILKESYEIRARGGGPLINLEIDGKHPSEKIEQLAQLCPYKRVNSQVAIRERNNSKVVSMEVYQRDLKPWVKQFFENYL